MSQKWSNRAFLFAGLAAVISGTFLGQSTAINNAAYLKILGWWAVCMTIGSILLAAASMHSSKPVRFVAIGFLSLTWALGVDPAIRLFHLLFR